MSKIYRHVLRLRLMSADDFSNSRYYLVLVESTNPNKIVVNQNSFGNNKADLEAIRNSVALYDGAFQDPLVILKSTGRIFDRGISDDIAKRYGLEFRNILTKEVFVGYIPKGWGIYEQVFDFDSKFSKVDTAWLDKQLTSIADSLRTVNGVSNKLTFPKDYSAQITKLKKFIDKINYKFGVNAKSLDEAINILAEQFNTATDYDSANALELLAQIYFGLDIFKAIDDESQAINNNGTMYYPDGSYKPSEWLGEYRKHIEVDADVECLSELIVDGKSCYGTDHRYVGTIPGYDLENKTYTYEFDYVRNFDNRHKFYFACGTFINPKTGETMENAGCDVRMPCLAIQLTYANGYIRYLLVRQSVILYDNTANIFNNKTIPFTTDSNGEFNAKLRIVLEGGSKKYKTLYANHGEIYASGVNYWRGNIIPVHFKIYHVINDENMLISEGDVYQPADVPLVCGVGNYDSLADTKYYGIRNFKIFKGDIVNIPKANIQPLTITENGTYTASGDVDGYSPITVEVKASGGDAPTEEELTLTGSMDFAFYGDAWKWFLEKYGSKMKTKDISSADSMFNKANLSEIPFDLNFIKKDSGYHQMYDIFKNNRLTKLPKMYNLRIRASNLDDCTVGQQYLNEMPEDFGDEFDWGYFDTESDRKIEYMHQGCYSLRKPNLKIFKRDLGTKLYFYYCFNQCYSLDELRDLPIPDGFETYEVTSNRFTNFVDRCCRLKNLTFATNNGVPYVVKWKSQTIDLSGDVGYAASKYPGYALNIVSYNSGITSEKLVRDDVTYQTLKNDPDWYATNIDYCRYNHDSAVATINSLPDTSAYLAASGGTNTIKFKGTMGSKTDGGAINTLTEAEIAVATAKGWTVTIV